MANITTTEEIVEIDETEAPEVIDGFDETMAAISAFYALAEEGFLGDSDEF